MFYVYFIINMIYNTHNRTTLLKQPNSDKKNNCAKFCETDKLSISLKYTISQIAIIYKDYLTVGKDSILN